MTKISTKEQAIQEIQNIMALYNINLSDIGREDVKQTKRSSSLSTLMVYSACFFVLMGAWLLAKVYWGTWPFSIRVLTTYGLGETLMVGLLYWYHKQTKISPSATTSQFMVLNPLMLLAFLLKVVGFVVIAAHLFPYGDNATLLTVIISVIVCLQCAAVFRFLQISSLIFVGGISISVLWGGSYLWAFENNMLPFSLTLLGNKAYEFDLFFFYILLCAFSMSILLNMIQDKGYKTLSNFGHIVNMSAFYLTSCFQLAILDLSVYFGFFVAIGLLLFQIIQNKMIMLMNGIAAFGYIIYITFKFFSDTALWPVALIALGASGLFITYVVQKRLRSS